MILFEPGKDKRLSSNDAEADFVISMGYGEEVQMLRTIEQLIEQCEISGWIEQGHPTVKRAHSLLTKLNRRLLDISKHLAIDKKGVIINPLVARSFGYISNSSFAVGERLRNLTIDESIGEIQSGLDDWMNGL